MVAHALLLLIIDTSVLRVRVWIKFAGLDAIKKSLKVFLMLLNDTIIIKTFTVNAFNGIWIYKPFANFSVFVI